MAEAPMGLWGGTECTFNQVQEQTVDQLALTGHADRLSDIDRFHALGLRVLRVPLLWERIETARDVRHWDWADAYMARLQALGIRPIVGLVHHGSGPAWADLTSRDFVTGLAAFAGAVAERYPWVRDWTPVNEPLTTARFGCLYGHWCPHLKDADAFWNALLTQVEGVSAAMREIRKRRPDARLIQTEDFGRIYATGPCRDQADFENQRRYLTWDLLAGTVDVAHPLRADLDAAGLGARLDALAAEPCPADVIGMNHYVTSDRFLDHRLEPYPAGSHGGNGRMAYADVEAVRVVPDWRPRWRENLSDLALRYGRPVAVTECHIGCTADEQIAWLARCWQAASKARQDGVDVEAVTVWALVGSAGWDRLLCGADHAYEAGVFDVSQGEPRPTPLADFISRLATGVCDLPTLQGWWMEPERLIFDAAAPRRPPPPLARLHPLH